jgi:hypothetical protein
MSLVGATRMQKHLYTIISESNSFNNAVDAYQRKKPAIVAYEKNLNTLISQGTRKDEMEFPLKNLPAFKNLAIGKSMVDKLVKSYQFYSSLPKLKLHNLNMQQIFQTPTPVNIDHSIEVPVEVMPKLRLYLIYQKLLKMQSAIELQV